MNSTCLLSYAQKCWRMPRFWSLVMGLAASRLPRSATQMLSTPSRGAMNDTYLPSGDRRPWVFSGLPNKAVRGMTGEPATTSAAVRGACAVDRTGRTSAATRAATEAMALDFMGFPGRRPEGSMGRILYIRVTESPARADSPRAIRASLLETADPCFWLQGGTAHHNYFGLRFSSARATSTASPLSRSMRNSPYRAPT